MLFCKCTLVDDDSISFEIVFNVGYKIHTFDGVVLHSGVCKLNQLMDQLLINLFMIQLLPNQTLNFLFYPFLIHVVIPIQMHRFK